MLGGNGRPHGESTVPAARPCCSIPYPVTQVVAALARYHPEAWLLITSGDRTTLDHRNLISFASSSATVHPQTQSLPQTSCLISTVSGAHHEQDPRH
ncbi:hypothetical protein A4X06_0g2143 [Tilletia controversa]|uniref:Uncharacterized protein n=1 Tax=Tilletia controversa TaxID=13291 RepID=A0A8X7MY57_9BASI|nr:hypothetical protein A4X06_0g2143 [Tilletia controversa]